MAIVRKYFILVVKCGIKIDRKQRNTLCMKFLSVIIFKHRGYAEGGVRYREVQYYRL